MENTTPVQPKRRKRLFLKIVFWFLGILFVILSALFLYGYFYYGKIVKGFLTEAVSRDSKGIYKLEMSDLSINLVSGNLTLKGFKILPDTALFRVKALTDTLSPILISLSINEFRIRGFWIMDLLSNRKINLNRIRIIEPDITIYKMRSSPLASEDKPKSKLMSIPLPKGLVSIHIREIILEKGKVQFYDCSGDSILSYSVPSCNIEIRNVLVDSAHYGQMHLFNSEDISVRLEGIVMNTKNGMNKISVGEIGVSTRTNALYIKNFHLEPLYNDHDYTRKLGYQTDRLTVRIDQLTLKRLNLRELVLFSRLNAGLLEIEGLDLDDYRDKRVPRKPGFMPPMPQDALRNLKTYLQIDTVLLKSGKATYREQVGAEPGTIFFDKMSGSLTNLTNDSVLLSNGLVSELKGTAWLMGKGQLDATVRFWFGDPTNKFTISGLLGPFDLKEINPMLTKLLPAKVDGGQVKKLVIPLITANDDVSHGKLLFYYDDLAFEIQDKSNTTWGSIKTGVINFVASDFVVNPFNPTAKGKMHEGTVLFTRDKYKGIINFIWKSVFSGLKSTMGFNSKEQKAVIKQDKKAKQNKKAKK
jgi:hypothetical protein